MDMDIETLSRVLHAVKYASRRSAKRVLHDAGMTHASGEDLARVLKEIEGHPRRREIERIAEALPRSSAPAPASEQRPSIILSSQEHGAIMIAIEMAMVYESLTGEKANELKVELFESYSKKLPLTIEQLVLVMKLLVDGYVHRTARRVLFAMIIRSSEEHVHAAESSLADRGYTDRPDDQDGGAA